MGIRDEPGQRKLDALAGPASEGNPVISICYFHGFKTFVVDLGFFKNQRFFFAEVWIPTRAASSARVSISFFVWLWKLTRFPIDYNRSVPIHKELLIFCTPLFQIAITALAEGSRHESKKVLHMLLC